MNFSEKDLKQIDKKGLTLHKIDVQIEQFKSGIPFIDLDAPATIANGILKLSDEQRQDYVNIYDEKSKSLSVLKFVPASGAATRMFKSLFSFLTDFNPENESLNSYINKHKDLELSLFFVGIDKLPFYDQVMQLIYKTSPEYDTLDSDKQKWLFVKMMLDENYLDYGTYPKGLLPFHNYEGRTATAFEEHMFEAALYASNNNKACVHFTISETHNDKFKAEYNRINKLVSEATQTNFDISFSFQKQSTDTIALTPENEPFREDDGTLLFRPSGHGALIENLNDLDADVIFIKNIDNVVVSKLKDNVVEYKKALAGVLLDRQEQVFNYLNQLETEDLNADKIAEIKTYLEDKLSVAVTDEFEKYALSYKVDYLKEKLNRPMRICGMVKNEGEPGGGPFWVKDMHGNLSLQIVESAQIDKNNLEQTGILKSSTHFNPVDLVCGTKDYKGKPFNLLDFVDPSTGFITPKTKAGRDLLALELPGLWNGAMADWNTIFVEVPLQTFNPVKTVVDLLKPAHQN